MPIKKRLTDPQTSSPAKIPTGINGDQGNFRGGLPAGNAGASEALLALERAVQESGARLRDALAAANLGTWNLDARTGKFTSDERFRAIFGHTVTGLSAEEALSNLHPDDLGWVTAAVEAATRTTDPVPYDVEYRVRHPDGSIRWVAAKGSARFIETSQGRELAGFEGTVGDITERKRAELNARFLAEVSQDLATLSDVAAIMETVGAKLGAHLGLSLCNFVDVNEAADETFVRYAWHRPDVPSSIGRYKLSAYLSPEFQKTLRSAEPFVVRDTSTDPRTNAAGFAALKIGAFVCMPLVRDGRWQFMINLHHSAPHHWSEEEIALLRELTSRVWTRLERVRIELELRESEARLASEAEALRNLNAVSSSLWQSRDLEGGLQEMLQATIAMLGADMGNVQVLNSKGALMIAAQRGFEREFLDCFRDVATDHDCACGRALRTGERLVIPDVEADALFASFRPAARAAGYRAVQSTPLLSRSGEPLGVISTHWRAPHAPGVHEMRWLDLYARQAADFIERSRNDEAARKAKQRFDIVKDSTQVGFWFCDLPFDKLEWDDRVKEHFWLPPDAEVTIDTFYERIHPEDREPTRQAIQVSVADKSHYDTEYRTVSPDGQVKWIRAIGRGFHDGNGQPIRFDGVTLDITERKRAEEALRTAKERAEAASRSKDDFLAALSHELRTPLTPVLMTADALKDDPRLPDDIREQLGMIQRNVALEARLIDDLLDLTAISHDKLKLRMEQCDLHTLVKRAMEMVAQDGVAKNLAINCEFGAAQPGLMGDLTRLQQVVWNLLRNAVKFTPQGGSISIRIRETLSPEGSPWLTLEIADSGIGIDAAHIGNIFQPFNQGAHVGNHRFGGLGLGLAIAHAVVIAHGGRIHARSEGAGRGATFVVDLPHAAQASPPLVRQDSPCPPSPPAKIAPLRLLLVEDHDSTLRALVRLLQRDGHHVTAATSIASALTAAAQATFDLVISDLGLPDGRGTQLMENLRSSYGLRGIALSGYGMQEDITRSQDAGFVAHLVKPVAISDLRRALVDISRTMSAPDGRPF